MTTSNEPSPHEPPRPFQFSLRGLLGLMTVWAVILGIMTALHLSALQMFAICQFLVGVGLLVLGSAAWRLWMLALGLALVWASWCVPIIARVGGWQF